MTMHRYGVIEATGTISTSGKGRQFNVRLPLPLYQALLSRAFAEGKPLPNYVRVLLAQALDATHGKKSR